jgi:di/tricarboxylate transporter
LAITYAATICGTGSLIGTSSNIVFKDYFERNHPNDQLNFLTFMLFSLPISLVISACAWVILCFMWLPKE